MWRSRWDAGILKAEALALLPCGLGMAFSQSHVMARRHQHSRLLIEVDEYSANPTQAFTFYNINQGRFQPISHRDGYQPPHVQMVDPVPHDAPKPPGYTRFVCVSDTHSRTDPIQMPYGDVLIHAGDFTELGLPSEVKKFNEWLGTDIGQVRAPPGREGPAHRERIGPEPRCCVSGSLARVEEQLPAGSALSDSHARESCPFGRWDLPDAGKLADCDWQLRPYFETRQVYCSGFS
ncbi:Metallophosphoesterase domain-containing protein 1 [Tupaia chinensis]|uniref:Metallophosphoesterase domain-containing protein 1 n=1 Tax=Tupaia chinensis TaxID=246437 RepID=L9KP46_TUPCH|nr:Metallophosphoesterase domain-containing protein 1 [Tupaia chinensis]